MLDCNPWNDLGSWPADTLKNEGKQLSVSKMKNEINHREPKTIGYDGRMSSFPLLWTKTGWHSTSTKMRKSEVEVLGEGANLYFKFLKYFMTLFCFATLVSLPTISMFGNGIENADYTNNLSKFLMALTLGNIGPYAVETCTSSPVPYT